jgi:hypothetical protein
VAKEQPAYDLVWQIATGHFLPRCLHVVAESGVADQLGDEPMSAAALAGAAGLDAEALDRMLRLLATAGIFEARGERWAHSDLSRLIRSDHPQSMRPHVRMLGGRLFWFALGELGHAASTGRPVAEKFIPGGIWEYFREHPEAARQFDLAMTARASEETDALLLAFDFTHYGVIADIGGGRGHILSAVLVSAPNAKGILFDLPEVVAGLPSQPRTSFQGGDFFKGPLPQADAYIVGNVLHNWADREAEAILRAVRHAAPPQAELLVLESIMPEGPGPHRTKVLDVMMMTFTGGRERTRLGYETLLKAGGFRLDRVVPTACPTSIIVGVPV